MSEILSLKHVKASYSQKEVLNDISFCLENGEILAIIGQSGSGKSTILKAIMSQNDENFGFSGEIKLDKNYGVIFQNPSSAFNALQRIKTHFWHLAKSKGEISKQAVFQKAKRVLNALGLDEKLLCCYPWELSGGMLQRVCIAMALFFDANLILADEPTSALDEKNGDLVLDAFLTLRKNGKSVLLVTHDMRVVSKVADKIVVIFAGYVLESGAKDEILSNPIHPYTQALLNAVPKFGKILPKPINFAKFDYSKLEKQVKFTHFVTRKKIIYE